MATPLTLKVEPRERAGKGSARAARREGFVPAVVYGATAPPENVKVLRNELVKAMNRGRFLTRVVELKLNGKAERVLPRDLQVDPVTDIPIHVDFLRLSAGMKVAVNVPVHFTDHALSEGLKRGGVLNIVRHAIECQCPADAIPEHIEASLKGLNINDGIHISQVELPKDVTPTIRGRDFTIATIAPPSTLTVEEEKGTAPVVAGETQVIGEEEAAAAEGEVPAAEGTAPAPAKAEPSKTAPAEAPAKESKDKKDAKEKK